MHNLISGEGRVRKMTEFEAACDNLAYQYYKMELAMSMLTQKLDQLMSKFAAGSK